jgi:hypothetical protein
MRHKKVFAIFLSLFALVIAGCGNEVSTNGNSGGGGGIFQPSLTLVTVKVGTTGTLPTGTTIGSITATVSASPSSGLSIANTDVTASGVGVGSTLSSTTNNVAAVTLSLTNATGIQTGEIATLTYHIAAGTVPTAGNFSIASTPAPVITAVGTGSTVGIGVAILSVSIQ